MLAQAIAGEIDNLNAGRSAHPNQTTPHCFPDGESSTCGSEFHEQARHVRFDRAFRDAKTAPDFLVTIAGCDELQNFQLPRT
jgi:hypothetical protein